MFNRIAVVGLGLLGGSLCKALKKRENSPYIYGYDVNFESMQGALSDGSIDAMMSWLEDVPSDVELVVVAVPVKTSVKVIRKILNSSSFGASMLLIDLGSVKGMILDELEGVDTARFIPCHPMAGSEKSGYGGSVSDLYRGAYVFVTPHESNKEEDVCRVDRFWKDLSALPVKADPAVHDGIVAYTSHLPHVIAYSLVNLVGSSFENKLDYLRPYLGGGFRDVTRIAESSPVMWREILSMNSENVKQCIDGYIAVLNSIKDSISEDGKNDALNAYLENGAFVRKELYK